MLTVHEVWTGKWKGITGFSAIKSAVHDLLERSIYRLPFDHYVCVSEATKKDLLDQKISPEKVILIHSDKTAQYAEELNSMGFQAFAPKNGDKINI